MTNNEGIMLSPSELRKISVGGCNALLDSVEASLTKMDIATPEHANQHPCAQSLACIQPGQFNAVFVERLFALNASLLKAEQKSRAQLLYDMFVFVVSNWDQLLINRDSLTTTLQALSSCGNSSRMLTKLLKNSPDLHCLNVSNVEAMFSFSLHFADQEFLLPFLETLYKENTTLLRSIFSEASNDRKRTICSLLCKVITPGDLNNVSYVLMHPRVKKVPKSKSESSHSSRNLGAFRWLNDEAFSEVTKMLNRLELEKFLPGFKHAMIHDSVLFALDSQESELLLTEMGLPLGVKFQIQKYVAKQQKSNSHVSKVSQKPIMVPISDESESDLLIENN